MSPLQQNELFLAENLHLAKDALPIYVAPTVLMLVARYSGEFGKG